jgi:hypothetical protein
VISEISVIFVRVRIVLEDDDDEEEEMDVAEDDVNDFRG